MNSANVGTDRATFVDEIRVELASMAHHAFGFTLEGKQIPHELAVAIREVQLGYQPAHHEDLGESPNAGLRRNPELLNYMVDRCASSAMLMNVSHAFRPFMPRAATGCCSSDLSITVTRRSRRLAERFSTLPELGKL